MQSTSAAVSSKARESRTPARWPRLSPPCGPPMPLPKVNKPMKDLPERAAGALFHTTEYKLPDATGHFGPYGGSFVAETLSHALAELNEAYARYSRDPNFLDEYRYELAHFVG